MLLSCSSTPLLIVYESVTLNSMLLTVISKYNTEHSRNVITAPNNT